MTYFDRFDICGAYLALENDWNNGGWLRERPSNQRRKESIGVQLDRIEFRPARDHCCEWDCLENNNQREIYVNALTRFGLHLDPDDETHSGILAWIRSHDAKRNTLARAAGKQSSRRFTGESITGFDKL